MNLFYQPLIIEGHLTLDPEESRHCIRVLRNREGDRIRLTDGKGFFYDAIIAKADPSACAFSIETKFAETPRGYFIHIAIAPTKNHDRIEWFVEKSVEFGVDRITLVECENSERVFLKPERLEKIAVSAMKQSLKASLPLIDGIRKFHEFIDQDTASQKFIAYVDPNNKTHLKEAAHPAGTYSVMVGPEGDFNTVELQDAMKAGYKKVSLGISRLRTETAGVAACHILNLING